MQNEETGLPRPCPPFAIPHSSVAARWLIFAAIALLALAIRLPKLGERPMHTDEAVNGYITGQLLAGQSYHYDPTDRHGPVLYLIARPLARLRGAKNFAELTETELRLGPALIGSATILLFGAAVEMFGFAACAIAALLFAVAPLPVYYSRYFIHETAFVAVTLCLLISGWRALKTNSVWASASAGLFAALLVGCKETFVIHFFALALATAAAWFIQPRPKLPPLKTAAIALGVFLVTLILLFTWFGQNWRGLADLFHAPPHLAARASGEGHQKPFGYYFGLIDSALVLFPLAALGICSAIREAAAGASKAGAMLAVYGLAVILIYSAIPYKTPWLALNLFLPLAILCGLGVQTIWNIVKIRTGRVSLAIAIAVLLLVNGRQTLALAFEHPADPKNPLAYAHTVDDILRLAPRIEQCATQQHLRDPLIAVVAADPWPLPWYLRRFQRVGFWQPGQDPGTADFYVTSTAAAEQLGDKLKNQRIEFFGLRPEVILILWLPDASTP